MRHTDSHVTPTPQLISLYHPEELAPRLCCVVVRLALGGRAFQARVLHLHGGWLRGGVVDGQHGSHHYGVGPGERQVTQVTMNAVFFLFLCLFRSLFCVHFFLSALACLTRVMLRVR